MFKSMNYIKLGCLISLVVLLFSCAHTPKDNTPKWAENNRFAVEMNVNCNRTTNSLGLSGCAFNEVVDGTLTIKNLLGSTLTFHSSECDDFTIRGKKDEDVSIPIKQIFTTDKGKSCSFTITQSYDKDEKIIFDSVFIGRFFISTLPNSRYYSHLKFSTRDREFFGIGWTQRKKFDNQIPLTIYPKGTKGVFRMMCGDEVIKKIEYTSTPFKVEFDEPLKTCDYAMVTTNANHPDIEFGAYMVNVPKDVTLDLATPEVKDYLLGIKFDFKELNTDTDPVVTILSINGKNYFNTNEKTVSKKLGLYHVRGYTTNGRVFYGLYNHHNKTWRTEWK